MMDRVIVNMLEDLHESALKENDRWTADLVSRELEEINSHLASDENER
jgi:hypothetical protein